MERIGENLWNRGLRYERKVNESFCGGNCSCGFCKGEMLDSRASRAAIRTLLI